VSAEADLFVAAMAREMKECESVFLGVNQVEPGIAAAVARRLWAPRLRLWAAGTAQIDRSRDLQTVGMTTGDPLLVADRGATFLQSRAFDDARRAPVVFAGGLQVDARGNANLAGIPDGRGGWKLRGPGSAGLPSLTAFADRFFLIVPMHEPRSLVERCALLSVLGDPTARLEAGLKADALVAVLTPLARFEPTPEGLVLTEVIAGLDRADLERRTGFAVREAGCVATREGLGKEEAAVIAELRQAAASNRSRPGAPQPVV
jgi:glutaconate CoA-transferase subunit B